MKIVIAQKGDTAEYCAFELKKYIVEMSRGAIVPEIIFCETLPLKIEDAIFLGLLGELALDTSDLNDPFLEDIIEVNIKNGMGYIGGSNQRSILMGVYKYCTSAGCRFIRPGADGDYVPKVDLKNHSFCYRKKADHMFRGQCTEGAVSYEHIRDTVYWLPKIGMNMYMIEGLVPYLYMHKWYGHVYNTKLRQKGQITDYEKMAEYVDLLEKDIKKTGIQLHTLGHGWMFEKFGIRHDYISEQNASEVLTKEQKKHLALVNGKRDLIENNAMWTNFCYSNPETRELLISILAEYIQKKPHVDFVHAWLADAPNNQCECDECKKMHPSDYYVTFLNELDAKLTQLGIDTRIVFIMYIDTVRPPEKMRLINPKRFVLLSAIGLHYEKGYTDEEFEGEIPMYERNNYHPEPNTLRLKWHKEWKNLCDNVPSMIFEYRFYTDMYCDMGHMQISKETHRDMKMLKNISFNGCMNDQTHRMFMPTSLPLIMMGETLFDNSIDFNEVSDTYFEGAFGADGVCCREYLEKLSELLCPSNLRIGSANGVEEAGLGDVETKKKCWRNNPYVAEKLSKIPDLINDFMPRIEKNISSSIEHARLKSWVYLKWHGEICKKLSMVLYEGACGNVEKAESLFNDLREYLSEHEMEYHNVFDVYLFLRSLSFKLHIDMPTYFE